MPLPVISGVAKVIEDPELRFTPSGMAICKVRLGFFSKKKDPSGEWVDGDKFWVNATLFKQAAENAAESLQKGDDVVVSGKLKTTTYETKAGESRSSTELTLDECGLSTRWNVVRAQRTQRSQEPKSDPWATSGEAPF